MIKPPPGKAVRSAEFQMPALRGVTVAEMRIWTDKRDGERWVLRCRHAERPTAVSLGFRSRRERRHVTVTSDILLDALTDGEIRDFLDRARKVVVG